ncbi:MAG: hypothetical protein ACJAYR_000735 [Sneathiella sp.]
MLLNALLRGLCDAHISVGLYQNTSFELAGIAMAVVIKLNDHISERTEIFEPMQIGVRPLCKSDIEIVETLFKGKACSSSWCGFSVLHQLPKTLIPARQSNYSLERACIALFLASPNNIQFLLQEERGQYERFDQSGTLLKRNSTIRGLMHEFFVL